MMIKVTKLKKCTPSMSVPGAGTVERPLGMDKAQGGRDRHNARHFADVMSPFCGGAGEVGAQYSEKGADER